MEPTTINYGDNPVLDFLNESSNEYTSNTNQTRKQAFEASMAGSKKRNLIAAIDNVLFNNEYLRNEWNVQCQKEGKVGVNYNILARGLFRAGKIDEETCKRASGILDNATNPGGANFLQTTVADYVAQTVESLGQVLGSVTTHEIGGDGNFRIPTFNGYLRSSFKTDAADFANLGTSIESNISSVTLAPEAVGAYVTVHASYLNTLSASRIQYILTLLAQAQARAYDDAILNGAGTGVLPLGMNQNALVAGTNFATGGDEFETYINAMSAISDVRRGVDSSLMGFMNTAAANVFKKLKYSLTNDRAGLIDITENGINIAGYKNIITDVIENTGTAGSKVSQITVGNAKTYHWGNAKAPTVETSTDAGFLAGNTVLKISGAADGQPEFANGFAKFSITTGI